MLLHSRRMLLSLCAFLAIAAISSAAEPQLPEIDDRELSTPDDDFPRFEITVTDSLVRLGGTVKVDLIPDVGPNSGTTVNLRRDLGLERSAADFGLRLRARLDPADRLELRAWRLEAEGRSTLDRPLAYDHLPVIPAGHELETSLVIFRGGAAYDRLVAAAGPWELWLGLAADDFYLRQELRDRTDAAFSQEEDIMHSYIFSGRLSAGWRINRDLALNLDFERSLPVVVQNIRHNDMRLGLGLAWQLSRHWGALAGYSLERIRIRDTHEDDSGSNTYDFTIHGLNLGLTLSF